MVCGGPYEEVSKALILTDSRFVIATHDCDDGRKSMILEPPPS